MALDFFFSLLVDHPTRGQTIKEANETQRKTNEERPADDGSCALTAARRCLFAATSRKRSRRPPLPGPPGPPPWPPLPPPHLPSSLVVRFPFIFHSWRPTPNADRFHFLSFLFSPNILFFNPFFLEVRKPKKKKMRGRSDDV